MELYKELLIKYLEQDNTNIDFDSITKLIQNDCYIALSQIKYIIEDDTLSAPECFDKIEQIVRTYEKMGSPCRYRHDFG